MTNPTPYPPPLPFRPARSNRLALIGFILSLLGIFTAGILSPVGLALSFLGMFRRPRSLALAGFVLGLLGTVVLLIWLSVFGFVAFSCFSFGRPGMRTQLSVQAAKATIDAYTASHGGVAPTDFDGNGLIGSTRDGWGRLMRYHKIGTTGFEIRSAGQDGLFGTGDDAVEIFDISTPGPTRVE